MCSEDCEHCLSATLLIFFFKYLMTTKASRQPYICVSLVSLLDHPTFSRSLINDPSGVLKLARRNLLFDGWVKFPLFFCFPCNCMNYGTLMRGLLQAWKDLRSSGSMFLISISEFWNKKRFDAHSEYISIL